MRYVTAAVQAYGLEAIRSSETYTMHPNKFRIAPFLRKGQPMSSSSCMHFKKATAVWNWPDLLSSSVPANLGAIQVNNITLSCQGGVIALKNTDSPPQRAKTPWRMMTIILTLRGLMPQMTQFVLWTSAWLILGAKVPHAGSWKEGHAAKMCEKRKTK